MLVKVNDKVKKAPHNGRLQFEGDDYPEGVYHIEPEAKALRFAGAYPNVVSLPDGPADGEDQVAEPAPTKAEKAKAAKEAKEKEAAEEAARLEAEAAASTGGEVSSTADKRKK